MPATITISTMRSGNIRFAVARHPWSADSQSAAGGCGGGEGMPMLGDAGGSGSKPCAVDDGDDVLLLPSRTSEVEEIEAWRHFSASLLHESSDGHNSMPTVIHRITRQRLRMNSCTNRLSTSEALQPILAAMYASNLVNVEACCGCGC